MASRGNRGEGSKGRGESARVSVRKKSDQGAQQWKIQLRGGGKSEQCGEKNTKKKPIRGKREGLLIGL